MTFKIILVFILLSFPLTLLRAQRIPRVQEDVYHPELEWRTIETEHFKVNYHEGEERTGRTVARIAEEIFEPVTSLYDHKPDQKVSFVIYDVDDISNGAAYFYDNKIFLYAPSMDFVFRGTHNWLRNVVTHEFTHIVQIQTAMKFGRTVPTFYLQWLGYESERRQDVLYGYPNVIASVPYSGFVVPSWLAEGVAQYNRKELRYDFWDSYRDMILRSYVLADSMLTWDQMSVFGKNSHGNESSYNAGFAFVHYLAWRYGEDKLAEMSRDLASFSEVTVDHAIERAVGRNGRLVYDDWKEELKKNYAERIAPVLRNKQEGEPIAFVEDEGDASSFVGRSVEQVGLGREPFVPRERMEPCCRELAEMGFANLYPRFSPDGKYLAFVSTGTHDYLSLTTLHLADLETSRERELKGIGGSVATAMSWSPDGKKLYYARMTQENPHWSNQNDLYVYDIEHEKETRLTRGLRALSPSVSPDGKRIVFVVNRDGTTNLAMVDADGSGFRQLTTYSQGEQVYDPQWSPSGDRIVFDYSIKDGRDIAWIRPDGSDPQFLVEGPDDSRSATFTHDGAKIIFSSDRTGISNLYSLDLASRQTEQLSNVIGGAFMPAIDSHGVIVYSLYASRGYKLYTLTAPGPLPPGDFHYVAEDLYPQSDSHSLASNAEIPKQFDWNALRSYDDRNVPTPESKPYKNIFTSLSVYPFVRVDNYNPRNKALDIIKLGAYFMSNDVLERLSFFAGADANRSLERDLFLQLNYRGKVPGFFQLGLEPVLGAEVYNITRTTGNTLTLGEERIPVDVSYNLLEFDFVMNQPIVPRVSELEFRFIHSRYTSTVETFLNPFTSQPVPGSNDLYLIANDLSLTFRLDAIQRSATDEINPLGQEVRLKVDRELNKFNGDGEYTISSSGELVPVYKTVNFVRAEMNWKGHFPFFFKNHTITLSGRAGSIIAPPVDEFFDFYGGGLVGMRGYPFYALGGNDMTVAGLNYRFPLIDNIDVRFLQFYFSKLYGSIFGDVGNAWTVGSEKPGRFKRDIGAELRLESFSFYSYPTRIFLSAAYGFDRFTRLVRSNDQLVTYGKELRLYFGILFGFDVD